MKPKTKKRPKTGGRQKGSGGVFVRLTIPKETAEQLPSNAKELKKEILDAIIERVKNQRSIMSHTCEFPHPEYGTLILSGQIHQAERNDLRRRRNADLRKRKPDRLHTRRNQRNGISTIAQGRTRKPCETNAEIAAIFARRNAKRVNTEARNYLRECAPFSLTLFA